MKWDNFTAGRVDAFKCADGKKQAIFWDGKAPGLGLRVTATGAKSYIFETTLANKTLRITIGDTKTWSIAEAQAKATAYKTQTDSGIDPRQVKADKLAAIHAAASSEAARKLADEQCRTLEDAKRLLLARTAWNAYIAAPHPKWGEQHRRDHEIAASPGGQTSKLAGRITKAAPLSSLLELPLSSITASVVQEWLVVECQTRPTFTHNSFRKFRTFIRWCGKQPQFQQVVHSDCCLTDAVKDIVPASRTKEGDSLQREQLPAWFDAVRKIGNPVISAYLQVLLITGARREELARLRWEDVDFQWRSLTIHDKVEGSRTIPLTQYASTLIAALPRRNGWVFSSPAAADGRLTEPRIAHTKALAIAGLPHVSLHGLRRSFGTLCEWVEVPSGVSAQIMGHKPSALAEKHYRRRPIDLLRKWHDMIEEWMLEQAGIKFVSNRPGLKILAAV